MKHRKIESEIQELTQLLNKVVLERQEIEEKEEQIRNTIECLQATENELENKNKSSEKHKKRAAIPHNKLDKNNREIKVGDKVRFLTLSKFKSKGGTVAYFTKQRVTSIDYRGIKISKESRNLEVIGLDSEASGSEHEF